MTYYDKNNAILNSFVGYLNGLREMDNRAALASLRRGMGQPPGEVVETAQIVESQLEVDTPKNLRATCYIAGSLFALHPEPGGAGNMGDHFRAMCGDLKPGEELPSNIEKRFTRLLESEIDELPDQLRQAVSLVKSKNVPINWYQLAQDVANWHFDKGRQLAINAWASHFWNIPKQSSGEAGAPTALPAK